MSQAAHDPPSFDRPTSLAVELDEAVSGAALLAREQREARRLAERFGLEYVDLTQHRLDNDLFRTVPFELMMRYGFIPDRQLDGRLAVVMGDPTDVVKLDELELLLGQPIEVRVGAPSLLDGDLAEVRERAARARRGERGLPHPAGQEDEEGEEVLSIDRITPTQPDHQAGRHHHLQRDPAPGLRHPHRDARARW
jgi:hypothetical protein